MDIEGQPPAAKESDKIALPLRAVTPDYFKLMGLALIDGREFRSTDDDKAPSVAIANRAFTDRYFPNSNSVGRKSWLNGRDKPGVQIVGEIANGRTDDLTQEQFGRSCFTHHLMLSQCKKARHAHSRVILDGQLLGI
jgi:putative ABC transport system permease protein